MAIRKNAAGGSFNPEFTSLQSATCNLFSINNWFVFSLETPFPCMEQRGLFGGEDFSQTNKENGMDAQLLKIDFDDSTLTCIDTIPMAHWQLVKSSFTYLSFFKIYFKVGDKEYKFVFDTGYNGSINMITSPNDQNINSLPSKQIEYGHLFFVAGGKVSGSMETKITDKIYVNDVNVESEINLVPNNMDNLVGMGFIQNFNWILDYKNKKVYMQPRKTPYIKQEPFFANPEKMGASFKFFETPVTVVNLVKNGKAETAGLQVDDIIMNINDLDITNIEPCDRSDSVQTILEKSSEIRFLIEREGKRMEIKM